jgi:hypothetical protein
MPSAFSFHLLGSNKKRCLLQICSATASTTLEIDKALHEKEEIYLTAHWSKHKLLTKKIMC